MSAGICPAMPRPPWPYTPAPYYAASAPVAVRRSLRSRIGIQIREIELARRALKGTHPNT